MTRKMSTLEARRQLSFLKSFDRKFHVLDRELQRLNRARNARQTASGGWPTDGLERAVKSLIGAGAVYGLGEISTWAREFLDKLGDIRGRKTPPTQTEMSWLADQIRALEKMQSEATEHAEDVVAAKAVPEKKTQTENPDAAQHAKKKDGGKVGSSADGVESGAEDVPAGAESSEESGGRHEDTWESALSPERDVKAASKADADAGAKNTKKQKTGVKDKTRAKSAEKLAKGKLEQTGSDGENPKQKKSGVDSGEEKVVAKSDVGGTKKKSAEETKLFVQSKSPKTQSPPIIMTGVTESDGEEIKQTAPLGLRALQRQVAPKKIDTSALFSEDAPHVKRSDNAPQRDTSESVTEISADDLETHSDTMPVEIVDIMEMSDDDGTTSDLSNVPVLPPLPANSTALQRFKWPTIAGVLLLLLGVSIYFNLARNVESSSADQKNSEADSEADSEAADKEGQTATVDEEALPTDEKGDTDSVASVTTPDTTESAHSTDAKSADDASKKKKDRRGRKKSRTNRRSSTKKAVVAKSNVDEKPPETKSASEDEDTGRLRISVPAGVSGDIRIFVDGKKRGKAPKILSLPVGLHEVRFEMGEKSSLKMVSIRKGSKKDITPKF